MQNFSSLTLKLREEFEVTDRWTTGVNYHATIIKFITSPLVRLLARGG